MLAKTQAFESITRCGAHVIHLHYACGVGRPVSLRVDFGQLKCFATAGRAI